MTDLTIGKAYKVNHSREGIFLMRIDGQDSLFAYGVLLEGVTKVLLDYNENIVGDEIAVRKDLCQFKEV
jgi:hypothetical protein